MGAWRVGKTEEEDQKTQTPRYKINKWGGCNVEHGAIVSKMVLHISKLLNSHHKKKKFVTMYGNRF